jgi:hypothetical protein
MAAVDRLELLVRIEAPEIRHVSRPKRIQADVRGPAVRLQPLDRRAVVIAEAVVDVGLGAIVLRRLCILAARHGPLGHASVVRPGSGLYGMPGGPEHERQCCPDPAQHCEFPGAGARC